MRRLIDPIELKKSIAVSNIIGDGKTLEELIDEQPDAQPEWKTGEIAKDTSVPSTDCISRQAAIDLLKQMRKDGDMIPWEGKDVFARIRKLPSAQPEIVYCGDCKYKDDGIDEDGIPFLKCLHGRSYGGTRINDYCSWAERREE